MKFIKITPNNTYLLFDSDAYQDEIEKIEKAQEQAREELEKEKEKWNFSLPRYSYR